ncbi:MAG: hypothetical protein KF690_07565, partial [Bacteroidetes bacterium]|nr:hypothetical protein [Bacteroidota bacterium]
NRRVTGSSPCLPVWHPECSEGSLLCWNNSPQCLPRARECCLPEEGAVVTGVNLYIVTSEFVVTGGAPPGKGLDEA